MEWSCRGVVEHVSDDLFAYAAALAPGTPETRVDVPFARWAEPAGDEQTIHTDPAAGNAGVVQVLDACGGLLSAVARTRGADARGWHPYGVSDPDGFAAMGTVETLLHLYDVAGPLGLAWHPDPDVVRRVLERLFPDEPTDRAVALAARRDRARRQRPHRSGAGTAPSAAEGRRPVTCSAGSPACRSARDGSRGGSGPAGELRQLLLELRERLPLVGALRRAAG